MDYEIVNGFHTGLLVPKQKTSICTPYRQFLTGSIDRKQVIERLKMRWRARKLFGNGWILNQGRRGSCNGYSCAGSLARVAYLTRNIVTLLSGEFVYAHINDGVDRGSGLAEGMRHLMKYGACPKDLVRHEEYLLRNISQEAKAAALQFVAHECYSVNEELELADALSRGFMAVVAVHASSSYSRLDHNGVCGPSNGVGNHSVTVDDCLWDGNRFLFDQPGTWGLGWGDNGRGLLTWNGHLERPNQYHELFVIRACTDYTLAA